MAKRKQILHLNSDELAVVLPVDYWRHFVSVYESLADECSDALEKESWLAVAAHVRGVIQESDVIEQWYEE